MTWPSHLPNCGAFSNIINIDEANLEFSDFDPPLSYKGALYPLTNGIIQAADMDENLVTTNVVSIEGKKPMMEAIQEFENNIKSIHRHVHITSGNSLAGPGFLKTKQPAVQ